MSLTPEQQRELIEYLERGEQVPHDYKHLLFPPDRREYELVYAGKEREEEILASTMAVPLQAVSTFGGTGVGWQNMLIFGDNLQAMKTLVERKKAGALCNADGTSGVRLIYIDPPFATRQEFRGSQDQKAYQDKVIGSKFVEAIRKRLVFMRELLSDDGSIFVHLDTKKSHYIKVILDELFGENNFRNEIIWRRQSAHSDSAKCGAIHDTILFYTRSPRWVWNEVLTEPSPDYIEQFFDQIEAGTHRRYARGDLSAGGLSGGGYDYEYRGVRHIWRCPPSTMEQYDAEGRLHWPKKGVPRLKRYLDEFEGVPLQDVWNDIKVIHNRSSERVGYPTQKPEALVARIITSATNEGDLVLDAFAGSGTTAAVAEKLGRRWTAIDSGKLAVYTIQKRMLSLKRGIGNKGRKLDARPFTLYNAGLYDFTTLKRLSWADWRFFALQLFECRDEPHSIGGLDLHGKRQGASVLVYNHLESPGSRVDEDTVRSIHAALVNKIGSRFFIIAPRGIFDFQQDYIELDGVRYYALRIPYSFINELHARGFTAIRQPNDETAVNDIVDAYGFDFIRPPRVEKEIGISLPKGQLLKAAFIRISMFASYARLRGEETHGELETFSMLMLDLDYDGNVFNLDLAYYADDLAREEWTAWFPVDDIGKHVMAVFIDIHGNEARELIEREQFGIPSLEEA